MPGTDRTQDYLLSAAMIETSLKQFASDQSLIRQKTIELLAELSLKNRKAPAVFQAGTGFDIGRTYTMGLQTGSSAGRKYASLGNAAQIKVGVLNTGDAEKVQILYTGPASAGLYFAWALAVRDDTNLRPESFTLFRKMKVINQTGSSAFAGNAVVNEGGTITGNIDPVTGDVAENTSSTSSINFSTVTGSSPNSVAYCRDEILCAGYKYLHIMGYSVDAPNTGLITSILDPTTTNMLTYQLIK